MYNAKDAIRKRMIMGDNWTFDIVAGGLSKWIHQLVHCKTALLVWLFCTIHFSPPIFPSPELVWRRRGSKRKKTF